MPLALMWESIRKLDMIYILMEQTDRERGHIVPAFRQLVYDAFRPDDGRTP